MHALGKIGPAPTPKTYATWNPSDIGAGITLSNGNLTLQDAAGKSGRSTIGKSAGKWYWENTVEGATGDWMIGIGNATMSLAGFVGLDANGWAYYTSALAFNNGASVGYGASYTTGDVIGVALDMGAGTLAFYKNGAAQGQAFSGLSGTIYPAVGNGAMQVTTNFGASAFAYSVPAGFNSGLYN